MNKFTLAIFAAGLLTATSMVSANAKSVVPEGGWMKDVEADWSKTETGMITGKESKPLSYTGLKSGGKDVVLNLYQIGDKDKAKIEIRDGANEVVFDGTKLTEAGKNQIKDMNPDERADLNSIAKKHGMRFDGEGNVEWLDSANAEKNKTDAFQKDAAAWAKENGATRDTIKGPMEAIDITAEHDKILDSHDDRITKNTGDIADLDDRFKTTVKEGKDYVDLTNKQTLESARSYTDARYNSLNKKIKKLRGRADAGIAGATAIGSLAFDTLKPNSIAGGLGVAKNKVAGAIGYQRNFNDQWRARGTLSVSDKYVQGGASVGYSW